MDAVGLSSFSAAAAAASSSLGAVAGVSIAAAAMVEAQHEAELPVIVLPPPPPPLATDATSSKDSGLGLLFMMYCAVSLRISISATNIATWVLVLLPSYLLASGILADFRPVFDCVTVSCRGFVFAHLTTDRQTRSLVHYHILFICYLLFILSCPTSSFGLTTSLQKLELGSCCRYRSATVASYMYGSYRSWEIHDTS